MNENAKQWIAALRSENYKQGQNYLHQKTASGANMFCCLGVACDLFAKQDPSIVEKETETYVEYENHKNSTCPKRVMDWLGLRTPIGHFGEESLTQLNDHGATFAKIADIIESEPDGLFE